MIELEIYNADKFDLEHARYAIEAKEKWKAWIQKIPSLRFDAEWDVQVIPPYGGAFARFVIRKGSKYVDVYLDVMSRLGWVYEGDEPVPYYEIYPSKDGDCARYYLNEVDDMMQDIRAILNDA